MAVWPTTIPQYLDIGMNDAKQAGFIRSDNSTGPAKQRKRFTATTRTLSGTMLFTAADKSTFETFYTTTINEGADEFTFPDPVDLTSVDVRFVEPPEFEAIVGGESGVALWRVSITVETLP